LSRLYDLASVIRSKNAGPLLTTIDLLFEDNQTFERVIASEILTPDLIANLYGISADDVKMVSFFAAKAIKITFPRAGSRSGSPGDKDVYGAQQHGPLIDVEIP